MSHETVFSIINFVAIAGWILLLVAPGRRIVTDVVASVLIPAAMAVFYIGVLAAVWGRSEGSFSTLAGVSTLFKEPWLLLAGWAHYLAFDLFVGSWEVRDARKRQIPHLLVIPCLISTLMFGPLGWLLYMAIRAARGAGLRVEAA
jgi:ABA4-like protein